MPLTVRRLNWTDIALGSPAVPKGTMALHRSLTSGLCRRASDPPGTFWGVGDRGPNIKPKDAAARYGLDDLAPLARLEGAKIMPMPGIGPALARFRLVDDRIEVEAVLPLRTPAGVLLDGLPPPAIAGAETEPMFALDGTALPTSSRGADTEGIAARADGMFWIGEEYGPSLLLVDEHGTVHQRLVAEGSADQFAGGGIPVTAVLPAIALARKLNRGFEALAISADGTTLFAAFQSPLAHPDRAAHESSDLVRIWALDARTGRIRAEYAYPIDPPSHFLRDSEAGPVFASDVKISELAVLPGGDLLVLERVTLSTHLYRITLPQPLPSALLDPSIRPTLEQLGQAGCSTAGLPVADKKLLFSSDISRGICGDLEGLLVLGAEGLLLSNDSDYGTEGAATQFWQLGGLALAD
ncbi:MAG: esterase-like activity of phytase family protein [Novosphingobium sp.]